MNMTGDTTFFQYIPNNMLVQIDEILKSIPFGKMQKLIVALHFMMYISTSFLVYNYCFLLMMPVYSCTYEDSNSPSGMITRQCSREDFCEVADPSLLSWRVDWSARYSLHNWISQLNLHCASSFEIGLFGTLYFAGYLVSCAIFPPLSDKFGRKIFTIGVCFI